MKTKRHIKVLMKDMKERRDKLNKLSSIKSQEVWYKIMNSTRHNNMW